MRRIMIVSDTHRKLGSFTEAFYKEEPIDALIHLGDFEGDEETIKSIVGCEMYAVPGNNDFFSPLDKELEIEIAGKKILLTHGHYYYVSLDLATIKKEAISRGFDIVMFGHTHRPVIIEEDGLTIINPGSISYPRQQDNKQTYIIMEIDEEKNEKNIKFYLKYI